jgi:integrase
MKYYNDADLGPWSAEMIRATSSAMDPLVLGPLAGEAEKALLQQGESENTLRSYRSALRYWAAWFLLRYGQPITLPVSEAVVVQFIVDHVQRRSADGSLISELPEALDQVLVQHQFKSKLGSPSLNTVIHRVAVLSKTHQLRNVANPCALTRVRELLAKARRGYAKRGALPVKKPALTREPLEALLATCDDSLAGLRDRALLLFAFSSGGRRRSEVVAATMENTRRQGNAFIFTMGASKTNQLGVDRAENDKPIVGRAATALSAWLVAAQIKTGAIFRRVRRGDVVGEPLVGSSVRDIVKRRAGLAGLGADFSAHSLRSGFVTEAGRSGVSLGETMAMTGHRTPSSLVGYFRASAVPSKASRIMDEDH